MAGLVATYRDPANVAFVKSPEESPTAHGLGRDLRKPRPSIGAWLRCGDVARQRRQSNQRIG
jgi:hypothetical protein